ncbi:MAG: phosphoribosyltransferase [Thermoplasmataceae archaeon]
MQFRAKLVSWSEIEMWCRNIGKQAIKSGFIPEAIIGLSRGGLVPARMLSDRMWIKDLYAVKTEHWGFTASRDGKAVLKKQGDPDIKGKRVLIVDDITDTGESMKLAYDYVKSLSPSEIRTSAMLHITRSNFKPDFYSEEVNEEKWAWFIFPWNVYEDLDNLIGRSMMSPSSSSEIEKLLVDDYGLSFQGIDLELVLKDLVEMRRLKMEKGKYSK